MDQQTFMSLGQFLNENLSLETCDNTLSLAHDWLEAMGMEDVDGEVDWLKAQGASCDCEVVIKLYIPAREKEISGT